MSKTILFLMLFASISIAAQQAKNLSVEKIQQAEATTSYKSELTDAEYSSAISQGDSIGFTVYDWQTNNSVQRRLHLEEDGTLHAVWTYGLFDDAFPGRGTAYNVRTNGVWGPIPNERIENIRTGWPSIGVSSSGRVQVVTHSGADGMHFTYKDEGQNTWTSNIVSSDADGVWPRSATDGEKIFAIISRQTSFGGLNNGLAFQRSMNGGDSWEGPFVIDILNDYYGGVAVDCYDIAASNGVLAVALGGYGRQTVVFKSMDDGTTWEAIPLAVTTAPFITDGTDPVPEFAPVNLAENVSLVVDDNGQIHLAGAWIFNFAADPNTAPDFLADRGGILYWTEGMDGMELIGNTVAQDWDGNGSNDYDAIDQATGEVVDLDVGWRFYSNVPVAMPSISVDENGNPFITYASVVDAHFHNTSSNNVETYFREIFIVKGDNSGDVTTWEGPYNVSDDANTEDVFPSLPNRIYNGEVNVLYMSDSEAGTGLQGEHAYHVNGIKMVTIDESEIVTPDYILENNGPNLDVFSAEFTTSQGCTLTASDIPGATAWDFPDGDLTDEIVFPEIDFNTVTTNQEIIFSVTDSDGNTAQDTILLSVIADNTPPELTLLCPDGSVGCASQTFLIGTEYVDPGFTISDNSECPGLINIIGFVDVNTPGIYELTYLVTDLAGNPTTVTRFINIIAEDLIAPIITVTGPNGTNISNGDNYIFEADASLSEIPFLIVAEDNLVSNITYTTEFGPNGQPQPDVLGNYTITLTANDGINETVVTYTVSVVDTTPPSVDLLPGIPTEFNSCAGDGSVLENITAAISVTDNLSANPTLNASEEIEFNQAGTYTATYSYTDDAGNESETITITYIVGDPTDPEDACFTDFTAPTITVTGPDGSNIGNGDVYIFEADPSLSQIPFVIVAEDDIVDNINYTIEFGPNGQPQPDVLGNYTVTLTANDGTNVTVVQYVVSVVDTTPPTAILLNGIPTQYNSCAGDGSVLEDIPSVIVATDNLTTNLILNASNDIPFDQAGTYTATYSYTDDAGNESETITITYIVGDTTDPNDDCFIPNMISPTITVTGPDGTNIVNGDVYTFEADASLSEIAFVIVAEDDIINNITYTTEFGPNGQPRPDLLGSYTVTLTANDGTNETVVTFIVSVVDTTPPTVELVEGTDTEYISCAGDGSQLADIAVDVMDNLTENPTLNVDQNVLFNQPGTYTANYFYTDDAGNESAPIVITYIVGDPTNLNDACFNSIEDIVLNNAITISPNPTDGFATLTVDGEYQSVNVMVVDIQGKEMMTLNNQSGTIQLNLSTMAAGVYYVKVNTGTATAVKKLIVE